MNGRKRVIQCPYVFFCQDKFPSKKETLDHCTAQHGFDFRLINKQWGLDFYQRMRLINFIRRKVKEDDQVNYWKHPSLEGITANHPLFQDDHFLHPVLQDDAFLYSMEGEEDEIDLEVENEHLKRARIAEEKASQLESVISEYQELIRRSILEKESKVDSSGKLEKEEQDDEGEGGKKLQKKESPEPYFSSYAHYFIHETMLQDSVRTNSYRDSMYLNKHLLHDKVVLDIGCGTGILSMFAAKSGATKVLGIDGSDIILKAEKIVKTNHLDEIITLVRGKVEEVTLPVEKVDIIISEWMGYFLLFESMLDTVIYARDKWLKPEGIVQPSHLHMLLTAACMEDYYNEHLAYWNDVYGFDMGCMREDILKEAIIDIVNPSEIISSPALLKTFDILHMSKDDQAFISSFELVIVKTGVCHALVGYFDTEFKWDHWAKPQSGFEVKFSTGPNACATHWKQTLFCLEEPLPYLEEGDFLKGNLTCRKDSRNFRGLNILIEWWTEKKGVKSDARSQYFILSS